MEVERISASRFVQYVEESSTKTLILDCRPFLAFNKGHIRGAVHSFCPSILKRRFAKKGLLILEHLLPQEVRKRLKCGEFSRAALYDNGEVMHESS
ncbi:hypothetical protein DPMN_164605 [Dreissena polymorpha]|uniref:Rhodanese domain-containing protein n=1 Tax=Dreissena polymorpha TaxID=45954 RepID=A0A9D4IW91_DREPO|nr:hypothetical protein DPMN_164605 [Dreissena polymorpha]